MPNLTVYRTAYATNVTSTLGSVACALTDKAVYELGIVLSASFAPVEIDKENYRHWMTIESEYGTNSITDTIMPGIQAHVIIDDTEGGPDFTFW
jgi:hypothetical protein